MYHGMSLQCKAKFLLSGTGRLCPCEPAWRPGLLPCTSGSTPTIFPRAVNRQNASWILDATPIPPVATRPDSRVAASPVSPVATHPGAGQPPSRFPGLCGIREPCQPPIAVSRLCGIREPRRPPIAVSRLCGIREPCRPPIAVSRLCGIREPCRPPSRVAARPGSRLADSWLTPFEQAGTRASEGVFAVIGTDPECIAQPAGPLRYNFLAEDRHRAMLLDRR